MSMNTEKGIPEEVKDIAKALAQTARNLGLHSLSGQFEPPRELWNAPISFKWEEGRHGDSSNQITMQSTFYVYDQVTNAGSRG